MKSVCVIGLGEIGLAIIKELRRGGFKLYGVDLDQERINKAKLYCNAGTQIPTCDIYIISVYTTQQVMNVLVSISMKENHPLVFIESTILPGTYKKIKKLYPEIKVAIFPHRYSPGDSEHHIFNLKRVLGAELKDFYEINQFLMHVTSINLIHYTTPEIAELCKPLENAYRFAEIAIAEEIKMLCKSKGINFNMLREAMNSKWNIDIKEARKGIHGKCLPKDIGLINNFFSQNESFMQAVKTDMRYRNELRNNRT